MRALSTDRKRVLVTGAHRSGTTFASYVLADELGLVWDTESRVRERSGQFNPFDVVDTMNGSAGLVMHGASCFDWLDLFEHRVDDLCIVFVWRSPVDVLASQQKSVGRTIDWPEHKLLEFATAQLSARHDVEHHLLVYPHSFVHHKLWTDDQRRRDWNKRQITPDGLTAYDANRSVVRDG